MTAVKTIRLLFVEDVESDVDLIVRLFEKAGYDVIHERVDSADLLRAALEAKSWDVVISDYRMPDFSAVSALSLLKDTDLDLPFIVVSGTIGEDTAVAMMKKGAHDYIMKNNLARLVSAVEREMKEARIRLDRRRTHAELIDSEARYRTLFLFARDGIALTSIESGTIVDCNDALCCMAERDKTELIGRPQSILYPSKALVEDQPSGFREHQTDDPDIINEDLLISKSGILIPVEISVAKIRLNAEEYFLKIFRNITERKKMEKKIKADLKEKENLIMEIHHRVNNNLQIMSSLLSLQSRQLEDKKQLQILTTYQGRIQAMALAHQIVYKNKNLSRIQMIQYINTLVQAFYTLYHCDPQQIQVEVSGKDLWLNLNQSVSCGMILHELISNAFKHAFPDERSGHIYIDLRDESGSITLEVRDNGIPLPKGFNVNLTDMLGMKLISDLTEQLNGQFHVIQKSELKTFWVNFKKD